VRYDLKICCIPAGKIVLNLHIRPSCHTLSKTLTDVKECSRTVLVCLHSCMDYVDNTVYLFNSSMFSSESKLMAT